MERPEPGGPHAIPRRHAPIEQLVRQGSFRGFPALSQKNSPFKRQLSLRLNDLPSTLQRKTAEFQAKNAGELGAKDGRRFLSHTHAHLTVAANAFAPCVSLNNVCIDSCARSAFLFHLQQTLCRSLKHALGETHTHTHTRACSQRAFKLCEKLTREEGLQNWTRST